MLVTDHNPKDRGNLARHLTSSRTIGASALWLSSGRVVTMIIAILLTPKLINFMGPERWGVLTLILSFVGAFGVFDLGIGRALMRNIAAAITDPEANIASQVKTSLLLLLALGGSAALMLTVAMHYWLNNYFKISPSLKADSAKSFYILCLILPLIVVNSGLWSVVSAFQMQRKATIWGTPLAALYYIAPLIIFSVTHLLSDVIWGVFIIRLGQTYLSWYLAVQALPGLPKAPIQFHTLRPVLKLSSWMTISNLISPVLSYCDRLVLASLLSAAAVGYYSTSSDLIGRLLFFPGLIGGAAFPAVATATTHSPERAAQLMRQTLMAIILVMLPLSVCLVAFGGKILILWLGAKTASQCEPTLRWFAIGITFVACDTAVAGFVDALGYPKVNSLFSIGELLVFVPILYLAIRFYGPQGAAAAWLARVFIDLCIRFKLLCSLYRPIRQQSRALFLAFVAAAPPIILPLTLTGSKPLQILSCLVGLSLYAALLWKCYLQQPERQHVVNWSQRAAKLGRSIYFPSIFGTKTID